MRIRPIYAIVLVFLASRAGFGSEPDLKSRTLQLTYQATIRDIPRDAKTLDAWVPLPQTDLNQTVHQILINAPVPVTLGREPRFGNQSLHIRADRPMAPLQITLIIEATRRGKRRSPRVVELRGSEDSASARTTRALGWPDQGACCQDNEGIEDRRRKVRGRSTTR